MKKGDFLSSLITGTFFLAINLLVTLVQYFLIGMSFRSCVFFFVLTAILDYAVANIYIKQRKKYRLMYYRKYGNIFAGSKVGFIYKKLPKIVQGTWEKMWFIVLRLFLIQRIIDWCIRHGYRRQKNHFDLKKKKETIVFVADTKAMFRVYYVVYILKLSALFAFDSLLSAWSLYGGLTWKQYLGSLILGIIFMLFGARIASFFIDLLKEKFKEKLVKFFEKMSNYVRFRPYYTILYIWFLSLLQCAEMTEIFICYLNVTIEVLKHCTSMLL
jgi:hypothetical protein